MWPSEGSVSEDVVSIFAEAGIQWIATDEEILYRSHHGLRKEKDIFKPYKLDILGNNLNIIFRDHGLSDSIGFIYSKMQPKDAVNDFIHKIHAIKNSFKNSEENHLISIILDGENCWEFYQNDGHDFLNLLYQTISDDPEIETVTISDYIEKNPPKDTLKKLWPGSWINGNFNIWIGHNEDNLAWQYLEEARILLTSYVKEHPEKEGFPQVKQAWENLYIAEGSDWTWWYGDDHFSGNDQIFDLLFRQYLINIYELLNHKVPDYLKKAIKKITQRGPDIEPLDFITPKIDGLVTNYFEWQNAGFYEVGYQGGSMHQVETVVKSFHYGFDLEYIYFRFDLNIPIKSKLIEEFSFHVIFIGAMNTESVLSLNSEGKTSSFVLKNISETVALNNAAALKVIEMAIPLKNLKVEKADSIEFVITVQKNGLEIERWPYQSSVTMPEPSEDFSLHKWTV